MMPGGESSKKQVLEKEGAVPGAGKTQQEARPSQTIYNNQEIHTQH